MHSLLRSNNNACGGFYKVIEVKNLFHFVTEADEPKEKTSPLLGTKAQGMRVERTCLNLNLICHLK